MQSTAGNPFYNINFLNKCNKEIIKIFSRCILNAQGIEPLVNLLKDENDRTKGFACVCLINMANDQIIREEVGLYPFVSTLKSSLSAK